MRAMVSYQPGDVAARVDRLRRAYELAEAEALAREALKQAANDSDLRIALGRVLMASHQEDSAFEAFGEAAQRAPEDDRGPAWQVAALSRQRRYDEAVSKARDALVKFDGSALIRVALGRVFLDRSEPEESVDYFRDAVTLNREDIHPTSWLVIGLLAVHRWDEAEALAHEMVVRWSAEVRGHVVLGGRFL